jgi:hypothetical protein
MQLRMMDITLILVVQLIMHNFKRPLILFEIIFLFTGTFPIFAQQIPIVAHQKDTLKQAPSSNERVVRVFLIEDKNPIKQVLNFDFSHMKKNNDSIHLTTYTTSADTLSGTTIEHLQEVFQMVFSGNADFIIKFDTAVLSKQTKILINDAIKNPLRWKNMDKTAIGGGIFIKKQPE